MDLYKKNRFLFWLLAFLVIMNLSAVATYFIYRQKSAETVECKKGAGECTFSEELELSDEQAKKVDAVNMKHKEIAVPIVDSIKEKRALILEELTKKEPDTNSLNNYASELADFQNQMQRVNIRQYLELKKIVTADQAQKLSAIYRELYGCPMQEKGMQHRNRKGQSKQGCSGE